MIVIIAPEMFNPIPAGQAVFSILRSDHPDCPADTSCLRRTLPRSPRPQQPLLSGLIICLLSLCPPLFSPLSAAGPVLLVGGAAEDPGGWSDIPYAWFVTMADSGIIVNIDCDEASSWYPGYFRHLGASDASFALQIPDRDAANDSSLISRILAADAVFIEGGDQWDYIRHWKGTELSRALQALHDSGRPLGGTSAGAAVLGDVIFDAAKGSAYPEETARDPYDPHVSFSSDFLQALPGTLTDSHFHQRGRLGRLIPMLARLKQDHDLDLLGIGVDEQTALCIDSSGIASVQGLYSVTFVHLDPRSLISLSPGTAPLITNVRLSHLLHGNRFSIPERRLLSDGLPWTDLEYEPLQLTFSDLLLSGSSAHTDSLGSFRLQGLLSAPSAASENALSLLPASGTLPNAVLLSRVWNDHRYFENYFIGALMAAALKPDHNILLLPAESSARILPSARLLTDGPLYILQARSASRRYSPSNPSANRIALDSLLIHFLDSSSSYDLLQGQTLTSLHPQYLPEKDLISDAHARPNPFNGRVQIRFQLLLPRPVTAELTDLSGRRCLVQTLYPRQNGPQTLSLSILDQPSGLYVLRLSSGRHNRSLKLLHLK